MNNRVYANLAKSVDRYRYFVWCVETTQADKNSDKWNKLTNPIRDVCNRELDFLLPMIAMLNQKHKDRLPFTIAT